MLAPEIRTSMSSPQTVSVVHGLFLCTVDAVEREGKMSVEFLWQEPTRPTRGPKPALTRDAIADAAIAVADAEGLSALSMRGVAPDLGYTKMSLSRYLPGKAELGGAMLERGIGAPPAAAPGDWRAALTGWA